MANTYNIQILTDMLLKYMYHLLPFKIVNKKLRWLNCVVLILTIHNTMCAQKSTIIGKVIDEKTKETLTGVTVSTGDNSHAVISDLNGNFILSDIPFGAYTIFASFISYETNKTSNVIVNSIDTIRLSIQLQTLSNNLNEVVVSTEVIKDNNVALTLVQKNSMSVSDGVTAETIKRTPDRNTSDLVKRINGVSVQDDQFVIIRGLNERYNSNFLNGAPLPSTENDRKAFSFDLIPVTVVDNIIITKTGRPDLPGDFAGGIVDITTKNIPEKNFISVSGAGGYNTVTTGKDQLYYKGGKKDWLGLDDGTRAMPKEVPELLNYPINIHQQADLAKAVPQSDWSVYKKKFKPYENFQISAGYKIKLRKRDFIGIIGSVTYNKTNNSTSRSKKEYDAYNYDLDKPLLLSQDFTDHSYIQQILASALLNVSFKIHPNHTISSKNLFCINSDDRLIHRTGSYENYASNPILYKYDAFWFTSNRFKTTQLLGDHNFEKIGLKLNWMGSYNEVARDIPNLRMMCYSRLSELSDPNYPNPKDTTWFANIKFSGYNPKVGGNMFWASLKEYSKSGKIDLLKTFKLSKNMSLDFKTGVFYQDRYRSFNVRQLMLNKYQIAGVSYFNDSLLYLDQSQIFAQQNMGILPNGSNGFYLQDFTKTTDNYTASSKLKAGYAMIDYKFGWFRLISGARIESYNQKLTYLDGNYKINHLSHKLDTTVIDILPSINLVFSPTSKQNIRLSYSKTVNRPEFREIAPFKFYDFYTERLAGGNANLQRALIDNYDLRYEWFPGKGQIFTVSGFYKYFLNPIEQIISQNDDEFSYGNTQKAKCYGLEAEYRFIVGSFFKNDSTILGKFLDRLTLFANYSRINSEVDVTAVGLTYTKRPLQGQSPYLINAGLIYQDKKLGYSLSGFVNKVGQRIYILGNDAEPDIWENGRLVIDLQATKSFFKNKLEFRFSVKDLLAQKQIFYNDRVQNFKYDKNKDNQIWVSTFGRTYFFQVLLNF